MMTLNERQGSETGHIMLSSIKISSLSKIISSMNHDHVPISFQNTDRVFGCQFSTHQCPHTNQ